MRGLVEKIAQVANAVGWQAGQIVSVLAANPKHIERFMSEGAELFLDGTFNAENGCLTCRSMGGDVLSPSILRAKKGMQQ
ncbi:hypothetical protein [Sinorhizobium medicae]|uniref:hypothetical protein n=1 Tax=Sinorhizobium medicae TaxID=110321 RepID=UPI000FD3C09D|nr:hypothetical protein [Sinorhizobium medicae]MDX1151229.1 hypothetical protein [Sinorhizobium medicae]RVJ20442.1 hypothetical protein CN184_18720 [Sinorhizobium medicae]RVJ40761.1 hypothetical protein CN180_17625 [Sinorhizobium medicae]